MTARAKKLIGGYKKVGPGPLGQSGRASGLIKRSLTESLLASTIHYYYVASYVIRLSCNLTQSSETFNSKFTYVIIKFSSEICFPTFFI